MDYEAALSSIDELVFQRTGKHLDSLQLAILRGVFNGRKYTEIADQYKCTKGHVKDEGYELWQILSEIFGEKLRKSNFCARVKSLGIANSHSKLVNPIQIGPLNVCSNLETEKLEKEDGKSNESNGNNTVHSDLDIYGILHKNQLNTISKLTTLGLTSEQIAEALDLPLDQVIKAIE